MTLQTLSEHEIIVTFLSLALLLAGAYSCGKLMEAIKAPKVVGEITGGLLFGGTCLYHFSRPKWKQFLWPILSRVRCSICSISWVWYS